MGLPGFAAVILAAGEGTRLNSARPKVLHEIAGQPMIRHVIAALRPLEPAADRRRDRPRHGRGGAHRRAVADRHAVPAARHRRRGARGAPGACRPARLATARSPMSSCCTAIRRSSAPRRLPPCSTRAAAPPKRPSRSPACGRPTPAPMAGSCSTGTARSLRIVEAGDASPRSGRSGCAMAGSWRSRRATPSTWWTQIGNDNAKGEFYLTDIVAHRARQGLPCRVVELPAEEVLGVNTRAELAAAEALMQDRLRRRAMEAGATLIAPETVFLCADTRLGRDVVIEPNVVFGPGVTVGGQRPHPLLLASRGRRDRRGRDRRPVRPAAPGRGARSRRACRQFRRGQGHPARRRGQGQPPLLSRRQRHRRRHQYRRRHDHLQLRRLQQVPDDDRRAARLSARTRRWSRRSRSATAPMSRPAASSPRTCRPMRWRSRAPARSTSRARAELRDD